MRVTQWSSGLYELLLVMGAITTTGFGIAGYVCMTLCNTSFKDIKDDEVWHPTGNGKSGFLMATLLELVQIVQVVRNI
jgi:hypothetical protein